MKIPLWLQIVSIISVLIIHSIFELPRVWVPAAGGVIFGLVYWLVRKVSGGKLGIADVLFGIFQGCCLELVALPVCLAAEVVVTLIFLGMVRLLKKLKWSEIQPIPFIPFMSVGLIVIYILNIIL